MVVSREFVHSLFTPTNAETVRKLAEPTTLVVGSLVSTYDGRDGSSFRARDRS